MKRNFTQILLGLVLTGSSVFAQVPSDGLVGYWPFNGNANDKSGSNKNGAINGATLTTDRFGNIDNAFSFDGSQNISVSDFGINYPEITCSYWFCLYDGNYNSRLITHDWDGNGSFSTGYHNANGDNKAHATVRDINNTQSQVFNKTNDIYSLNTWYNLIYTYTNGRLRLYINGQLKEDTVTSNLSLKQSIGNLYIGGDYGGYLFRGKIDDIRIYNKVLSDTEIVSLANETTYSIKSLSNSIFTGKEFELEISTDTLKTSLNIISYQFDLEFDNSKVVYKSASVDGTIASGGSVTVNTVEAGKLNISYMSSTPLSGAGNILKLNFKAIDGGTTTPIISNFLYNTDTVYNVSNGTITIAYKYGDVDVNGYVQAYDAALALQYSVGIDALPSVDPLPWEAWRVKTANVDSIGGVTANDAALILQYSAKIINTFPANSKLKSAKANNADVTITQEGDKLIFRSQGNLIGLNMFVKDNIAALGQPTVLDQNMIKAININDNNYAIGLATAYAPAEGSTFMTIPLKSTAPTTLSFDMIINTENKVKSVSTVTAINNSGIKGFAIYPNPANEELKITMPDGYKNASVSIFDLEGKQVYNGLLKSSNSSINVNSISSGIYTIQISNGSETLSQKFVKK